MYALTWREATPADYPSVYLNSSFHTESLAINSGWTGNYTFSSATILGKYPGIAGSEFISPELDLHSETYPSLVIHSPQDKSFSVFVSYDGINYSPIAITMNASSRLPQNTKRIKIKSNDNQNIGISCIQILNLDESHSSDNKLKDLTKTILQGDDQGNSVYDEVSGKYIYDASITSATLPTIKNTYLRSGFSGDIFYKIGNEYIKWNDEYKFIKNGSYYYLIPGGTTEIRLYKSEDKQFSTTSNIDIYANIYNPDISGMHKFANNVSTKNISFYDINRDGIMEYYFDKNIYDFQEGFLNNMIIIPNITGFTNWINYNNDDYIDYYYNEGIPSYISKGENTLNFTEVYSRNDNKYFLNPIDYDNDGKIEFLEKNGNNTDIKNHNVLSLDCNGNWRNEKVKVMTPDEYNGIKKKLESTGGMVIPGMNDMFITSSYGSADPSSFGNYNAVDINGDGLIDFVDTSIGCYFLNTGENSFVEGKFGGQAAFRDFNNDGLMDLLVYNGDNKTVTLYLARKDGKTQEQKLISGLHCSDKIWCYDFDKDGDVDILIPFDFMTNNGEFKNGASYLVMMENTGDGTFKKHENYLDGEVYFHYCLDIDADGNYEVIAKRSDNEIIGKDDKYGTDLYGVDYVSYKISGINVSSVPDMIYKQVGTIYPDQRNRYWNDLYPFIIADIDNNGILECIYGDGSDQKGAQFIFQVSDKVNSVPQRIAKPKFAYDARTGLLKVFWKRGTDTESSDMDLTYALRIGTAPDKGDILYVHALSDGTRRNLLEGNNGYSTLRVLNTLSWPAGKYYISVQSVDPNCRGSQFSEYTVFEKKEPENSFIISYKQPFAVGETCFVTLKNKPSTSNIYTWNFSGAEIISKSDDGSSYQLRFKTSGEKRIYLQVLNDQGIASNISEQFIEVTSGNIKPSTIPIDDNTYLNDVGFALDLDEDGIQEIFYSDAHRFMEGNPDGIYSKIKKTFNSNANLDVLNFNVATIDLNNDGMCDVFGTNASGTLVKALNKGDKDLDVGEQTAISTPNWGEMYDFDNDGVYDIKQYYNRTDHIYKNNGDYINFEEIYYGASSIAACKDYSNNGLTDLLVPVYKFDEGTGIGITDYIVYENNGNWTFTEKSIIHSIKSIDSNAKEFQTVLLIDDFDGDGKPDFFIQKELDNIITYFIEWGDSSVTSIDFEHEISWISAFDLDNNGFLDLRICNIVGSQGIDEAYAIYLYPNHQYKIDNVSGTESDYEFNNTYNYYTGVPVFYRSDGDLSLNVNVIKGENSAPQAPTCLRTSQTDRGVMIEWNHSADKETPAKLMRYNLSVKRKGAEGEGAYLISPCNSTKNEVHIPSHKPLISNNRFFIPLANIAPGEYEIQVQGIDRWNMQSDFSEIHSLTVTESAAFEMHASTAVDVETEITITGNISTDLNWDGATVKSHNGNKYIVVWDTEGMKTVTNGKFSQQIYVNPKPQGAFALPENVLAGAIVNVTTKNASGSKWEISSDGSKYEDIFKNQETEIAIINEEQIIIRFSKAGKYDIRHIVSDEYSSTTYTGNVTVTDNITTQEISLITIDETTGKHLISWEEPQILPAGAESINIYKETSRYEEYELIANVPIGTKSYIDKNSIPEASASRYRLSWVLNYGESEQGRAHQAIHVMINRGMGSSWNLMWSKYEGIDITSYRILRGSSPGNLSIIAEVSGSMNSYCDMNPTPGDALYYAVEIVPSTPVINKSYLKAPEIPKASRSNIVSVINASNTDFVTNVEVKGENGETNITLDDKPSTRLIAYVYPNTATFQGVNWIITNGEDIITIDKYGIITATGKKNGSATVRAYAIDGSGIYGEIKVNVAITSDIETAKHNDNNYSLHIYPSPADNEINIEGIPRNGEQTKIYIFNTNGELFYIDQTCNEKIKVDCTNFNAGVYFVKTISDRTSRIGRFIKK